MVADAGPGRPAYVDADIEGSRSKGLAQGLSAPSHQVEVLLHFLVSQFLQAGGMPVWRYHQVPWVIGEPVQNDKVFLPAVKDEIGFIVLFLRPLAENTPLWLFSQYEFDSPGCPDMFHVTLRRVF